MGFFKNKDFSRFVPVGWVQSLDVMRGLAIVLMTLPHQTLLFDLQNSFPGDILFLIGVYYTRPIFIGVSGMALLFNERKDHRPFRIFLHGAVLFLMAWSLDILVHRSLKVDWDIFQLIGACYGIAALTGCLGFGIRRFVGLAILVMVWVAFPLLRPNEGLFPIWPHGIYFLAGYLLAVYATSRFHRAESTLIALALGISYMVLFYHRYVPDLLQATLPEGIILTIAAIFLTSAVLLLAENRNYMTKPLFAFLLRFGRYPLTLYFAQQSVTVFGLKYHLSLKLTQIPLLNWGIQASLLLGAMYFSTHLFDRAAFFSMEFWLRSVEKAVLRRVPRTKIVGESLNPG